MNNLKKAVTDPISQMVSLSRGLYARVGRRIGCDVSYVSRVARGERRSAIVETALKKEFGKVLIKLQSDFNVFKASRAKVRGPRRASKKLALVK